MHRGKSDEKKLGRGHVRTLEREQRGMKQVRLFEKELEMEHGR